MIRFFVLALLLWLASPERGHAQNLVAYDLKLGARLDLKKFGGNDIDFIVFDDNVLVIHVGIVDRSKMVAKAVTNVNSVEAYPDSATVNYTNSVVMVPTRTGKEVPKEGGINLDNGLQKLFPVYEDDKLKIYYQNTIATSMGHCRLQILTLPKK